MIILFIEVLIIIVLAMMFSTLLIDQRKNRAREMRVIKLKGYWDGGERRSTDRLNLSLEVKYSLNGKTDDVKTVDISAKGIRLLMDEKIEKGTAMRLDIKLPGQKRLVKASAAVVWTAESKEDEKFSAKRLFNTGIKFHSFQKNGEKQLFDFIYSLQPQKSQD
ncbi:unnamed protein product [marine sediment metagenome]|uniref:PilZ domain-containing protein n=1 Tax=marine sediment metagenome TaxID=412755 RepID=X0XWS1_9ZZZZ